MAASKCHLFTFVGERELHFVRNEKPEEQKDLIQELQSQSTELFKAEHPCI